MSQLLHLKCKCGVETDYEDPINRGGYNIGDVVHVTGWKYIPYHGDGDEWICPDCAKQTEALALQLRRFVSSDWISLKSLLPRNG